MMKGLINDNKESSPRQELKSLFSSISLRCRRRGCSKVGEPSAISSSIINTETFKN